MAVESRQIPLGTPAPDFSLPAVDGAAGKATVSLEDLRGEALLVAFVCNHCPYVRHVETELGEIAKEYAERGVSTVAICTNDADAYPDDKPEVLLEQAERAGWNFPYLVDATQEVGRAYGAECTPDLFVFDAERRLAYHGALDASTPKNDEPLTGELLRNALDLVLEGKPVPEPHRPAMGCSIKWKTT